MNAPTSRPSLRQLVPSKWAFALVTLLAAAAALALAALSGCYNPHPADGAFKCTFDENYACPSGMVCDRYAGLCVNKIPVDGGAGTDLAGRFDAAVTPGPRTCDERVRQGAFSGLVNLAAVNGAGDQTQIALSADGKNLYYLDAGTLKVAAVDAANPKSVGAPQAVTLTSGPSGVRGGSLSLTGDFWFVGDSGGNTWSLYTGTKVDATHFNVGAARQPTTSGCAFDDPVFFDQDSNKDLLISFALGGCSKAPMIAEGTADKLIGAFYGALSTRGLRSPFPLQGGLTLLAADVNAAPTLVWASRPDTQTQFSGPNPLPMAALGATNRDLQAVVAPGCHTLYLVSDRPGTVGGYDLWAADIAAQ